LPFRSLKTAAKTSPELPSRSEHYLHLQPEKRKLQWEFFQSGTKAKCERWQLSEARGLVFAIIVK